ncbi:hypothetical protein HDU87_006425 [Geranomyces variabilis]|uniref:F-box domain-containing protein n=1 Tax=Geranomyces variabilis TaxID=109894 RepID=A0AAD5TFV8_9FUNG|nr:hypothetical protein HDU87_006425 [Geranomyces variabilis]
MSININTLPVEIRDLIIKRLEWKDVWRLRSVSSSLRRQCLNDHLLGHALLNSRGPYHFACKHDLAVKAPALVLFDNYDEDEGHERQWMEPSTYDPVRETVTFLPVAVEIGACNLCAENARAGACLREHERNGIKAGTAVPLTLRNRRDSGSAGARFEGWYPAGQEYFFTPLSVETYSDSDDDSEEEGPRRRITIKYNNVTSFTVSISWILQGICSGYVEARGLRPRLLRRLAEKLDKADATPRQLFEDPQLNIYGTWVGHERLFYGDMQNAPRNMVRTAKARTADTLLREDRVFNAMAAPEDYATVAGFEWWLFEQYFKPHGLSFDGKTVPPVDKIAVTPDLMEMPAAHATAFEALFKVAFKPLMKYLESPGPLFACSRFLKIIGSQDAKAAWMFHRNEELFETITLEAACPDSHPKALRYSKFIWTALRTPGFVLAYANACVTESKRNPGSSASKCRASTAWVDVIVFGLRNASEPVALLTALLRNEMIANQFDACWNRMLYFGVMPIAEAIACENFRWKEWECLAVRAARMQSFSENSEGWKYRTYLWSKETSSRYLWEIISLGKLDLPTCGADVLAEVVITARDDIFYELVKRGCAYAPVRNRNSSGCNTKISILHYAVRNPQFLEPLLDVPEVRRSGWGAAIHALLPSRRYAISAKHPSSEIFRIIEVLISRVEPDIIESYTLKQIAIWLGEQSESFRAAQLATLHARVGTTKLRELVLKWKYDKDVFPAATALKEILGEILSFEELLEMVKAHGSPIAQLFEVAGNDAVKLQKVTIAFLSTVRKDLKLPDAVMIESFEQVVRAVVANHTWPKLDGKELSIRQATGNLQKLDARLLAKLVIDYGHCASLQGIQSAFRKPSGRAVIREIFKGVADWIGEKSRDECAAAQLQLIKTLAPYLGKCRPAYLCRMAESKGMNDLLNCWAPERLLYLWSPSLEALASTCVAWRLDGVARRNRQCIRLEHVGAAIRGIRTRLEKGHVDTLRREEDFLAEFLSTLETIAYSITDSPGNPTKEISRIAFEKGLPRLAQAWGASSIAQYLEECGVTICKDDNPASKSFGLLVLEQHKWCDYSAPVKVDDYGGWAAVMRFLEVKPTIMVLPYQDNADNRLARFLPLLAISLLQLQSPTEWHDFVTIVIPALHRYISRLPETSSMRVEPLHPAVTMLLDVAWQVWLEELSTMYGDGCPLPAFTRIPPRKFREAWVLPALRSEPDRILQWADAPPRNRRSNLVFQRISSVVAAPRQTRPGAPPAPRAKTIPSAKQEFLGDFGKTSAASSSVAASATALSARPRFVFVHGGSHAASIAPPPSASSKAVSSFGASSFATSETGASSQSGLSAAPFTFRATLPASQAARTTRPGDGRRPRVTRKG